MVTICSFIARVSFLTATLAASVVDKNSSMNGLMSIGALNLAADSLFDQLDSLSATKSLGPLHDGPCTVVCFLRVDYASHYQCCSLGALVSGIHIMEILGIL